MLNTELQIALGVLIVITKTFSPFELKEWLASSFFPYYHL